MVKPAVYANLMIICSAKMQISCFNRFAREMHGICDSLCKPLVEIMILLIINTPQKNDDFPNIQTPVVFLDCHCSVNFIFSLSRNPCVNLL